MLRSHPTAHAWRRTAPGKAISRALAKIPALCDEIDRLNALSLVVRREYHNLVAAARATLTAADDGEPDPLYYVRDELSATGHLPGHGTATETDGRPS